MANPFSGSLQYNSSSVSDKLERTFAIQAELINALRTHGCPSCLQLLREIVKKYGGMSESNQTFQTSNGREPLDIFDIRK
jgi:DNA-binding phage protein